MPVGEVRVRHGFEARRVDRVRDVEQEAVALAGAARKPDRRVQRDVVALGRAGRGALVVVSEPLSEHPRERLAERDAVRGRRLPAPAALGDDLREVLALVREHTRLALDVYHEGTTRPRGLDLREVGR